MSNSLDEKQAEIRTKLERRLAAQIAEGRSWRWIATGCAAAALVLFMVAGSFESLIVQIPLAALGMLSLVCGATALISPMFAVDEAAGTRDLLQALDVEQDRTAAALTMANSGVAYAVFLRSFTAEAQGLSHLGKVRGDILRGFEARRAARFGDWYEPDLSHLEARNRWLSQLEVLRAVETRFKVILLGNTRLETGMRRELANTGIFDVTIQVHDWWEVFRQLAEKAKVIVLYVEVVSPSLCREMRYIRSSGYEYILCGPGQELDKLNSVDGLGPEFIAGASGTVTLGLGSSAERILQLLP